jgi:hypothetical protein
MATMNAADRPELLVGRLVFTFDECCVRAAEQQQTRELLAWYPESCFGVLRHALDEQHLPIDKRLRSTLFGAPEDRAWSSEAAAVIAADRTGGRGPIPMYRSRNIPFWRPCVTIADYR